MYKYYKEVRIMKKKALFIGIHYWGSPFKVGTHHLAECLSNKEEWEVLYLSLPLSPLHKLSKKKETQFNERYKIYKSDGITINPSFKSYVPFSLLVPNDKPICNTEFMFNKWHAFSYPNLMKKLRETGYDDVDLIYMDNPTYHFLLDKIKYKKSVFRVADNHKGFQGYTALYGGYEDKLINKVDLVLYTAKQLEEILLQQVPTSKKMYFPNGVRYDFFTQKGLEKPMDIKGIDAPICMYVGALAEWIDYNLINYCAKKLKHIAFVFIGPSDLAKEKLMKLDNIYLLGTKPYEDIPQYLHHAGVGIIPFNTKDYKELIDSVNPLKLYEYMSCGIPVVSTSWKEIRECDSPAYLSNEFNEFAANIEKSIESNGSNKTEFENYAKTHDWNFKLDKLINYLEL
ncbi:glycosyltransferase family 1 protein [Bacillus cereus]|nr:glycosyltransferase family 1 protein [Bacillus cereus]